LSEHSHRSQHGSVISTMAAVCLAVTESLAQKFPVCLSCQRLLHSVRSLSLTSSICADMATAECANKLSF